MDWVYRNQPIDMRREAGPEDAASIPRAARMADALVAMAERFLAHPPGDDETLHTDGVTAIPGASSCPRINAAGRSRCSLHSPRLRGLDDAPGTAAAVTRWDGSRPDYKYITSVLWDRREYKRRQAEGIVASIGITAGAPTPSSG
jgi:hypothetical protein